MGRKIYSCIIGVFLCGCLISFKLQAQENTTLKQALKHFLDNQSKQEDIALKLHIEMYAKPEEGASEKTNPVYKDTLEMYKKGVFYKTINSQMDYMQNDEWILMVNKVLRTIFFAKLHKVKRSSPLPMIDFSIDIDTLLNYCDSVALGKSPAKGMNQFEFYHTADLGQFDRVDIRASQKSGDIHTMIYHYKEPSKMDYVKVNYQKAVPQKHFSILEYVYKRGDKWYPTNKYTDYQVREIRQEDIP